MNAGGVYKFRDFLSPRSRSGLGRVAAAAKGVTDVSPSVEPRKMYDSRRSGHRCPVCFSVTS